LVKDLRQSTPTDIAHELAAFRVGRRTALGFERLEQFDGGEVVPALLLGRADADFVVIGDAVVPMVARRLGFGCGLVVVGAGWLRRIGGFYSSGWRKR
jgi:hypothetical protein